MTCGFCSTGCGLTVHLRDGEAVNLTPSADYPVNLGMACPKGWEALTVLDADDRATTPLLRDADGDRRPVDWQTALTTMADRFKAIQAEHGDESIAFLSTGQIASEEMALLGAVAKFGMGMVHGDGNTRQCMATAAVAYKQSFGFDAPPATYKDFEEADCIVVVGGNLCISHPIMWERVMRNRKKPEIIVIDPRRTETAASATMHLPVRPKADLVLFYGLANLIIENGWVDRAFVDAHTNGFDEYARFVRRFGLLSVAYETGLDARVIERVARLIHEKKAVSFWWTMGVNQSHQGVRTAQAIINLALMTGNIGKPGTGANSVTGQCNAMGSRLFSSTSNLLGGHDFADPDHRAKVAGILNIPEDRIPTKCGWAYDQIIEGVRDGKIKGLWVIATNPAHSWINQSDVRELLGNLDFLVVQDMYDSTETALAADLLLPAAGWGEKEGTFINSERRIGLIKKVRRAPGLAPDGLQHLQARRPLLRLRRAVRGVGVARGGLPDPQAGLGRDAVRHHGDQRLPRARRRRGHPVALPARRRPTPRPSARLFADGRFYHPDGRARFVFENPRPMGEEPDDEYPLILLTGRGSASQWHTQTRTPKSAVLRKLYPAGLHAEIHPADAALAGIAPGQTGGRRVAPGKGPGQRVRLAERAARPGVPADARPGHEPIDVRRLRPLFPAARLQGLRRAGPGRGARRPRPRPGVARPTTFRD